MPNSSPLTPCPVFIDGQWRVISNVPTSSVFNPSTGEVIAECPLGSAALTDEAVAAAQAAFPAWRDTPVVERARLFFRYRQLVEQNFDRLCQCVCREHGKTLSEARGSIHRAIENIEYACGAPTLLFGDSLSNLARRVD
jgi:malonate-semialdehyde dehydrogenase (acetylating)/methylmalonate-semialdehyde dehydrogenase